ncbi:MAG TPA: serine/threonine-protein kinase, partial [Ktedonobacteraceae bacterium]
MLTLEGMQLGNYDVIRRIRVGGMGAVYEGRQRSAFGRRVAIKVILGSYATDREMRRRFAREARTIAELHHPHILPLIEFGDEQGILYLVMPFSEGGTLTGYLRHSLPDFNDVATIFLQLLDAVEYAHDEGLIHRDIKSSNVLLEARRDGPPYVYLADFGLVRYSEQIDREHIGKPIPLDQIPGTPHYMAPEQTRGIVTTATDIYALGVLLYQMLVGELPYDDPDDVKVVKMHLYAPIPSPCDRDVSIPTELGEVVRKAMAKRAEGRFGSVAEMRQVFLAAIEGSVPAVKDDSDLSELDEFITTAPPARHISVPLSPPGIGVLAPQGRLKHHRVASHFPPNVNQSMRKNVSQSRKLFTLSVVAAILVPLTLLVLLLMPRVSGFSFFPMGFPVFGTA